MARELTFLLAGNGQPMARTWRMVDGQLVEKDSDRFPALAKNVTSVTVPVTGINDFYACVLEVANAGGALLKGDLMRPVQNESRRGLTVKHLPTWWLHLDYDREDGFDSREDFLAALDPALADVSYIYKHSASAGVKCEPGLRGHYFILLTEPVSDKAIALWLKKLNLTVPELKRRVQLSANGMALKFPLDVSTNENSKLHLIAPPQFVGFDDPLPQRFELVNRGADTFCLEPSVTKAAVRKAEHQLLAELQERAGVDVVTPVYTTVHTIEVLANPKPGVITESADCGDYVRCNLNGGDSWAYWYWKDRPDLLFSFKGEPAVKLEDIDPQYYARVIEAPREQVVTPFVLRDAVTDLYFNGTYDATDRRLLSFNTARTKERLNDFMMQYGYPRVRTVPDWTVEFDPTGEPVVDIERRRLNVWAPTKYTYAPRYEGDDHQIPSTIDKVIRHICVDGPTYRYFVNWLAFVFQTRKKSMAAWLFQGVVGTGKGTLFHQILTPLFGSCYCYLTTTETLEGQFNGFLRHNIITWIDEGDIAKTSHADKIMRKLKNWITDPTTEIRAMHTNPRDVSNFSNFILATNSLVGVKLEKGDRRWNVAPRQIYPLQITSEEYQVLECGSELMEFARFLASYPVNEVEARTPMQSAAKDTIVELSRTTSEDFFVALQRGDLGWFADLLRSSAPFPDNGYLLFDREVRRWIELSREADSVISISQADLRDVYTYANPSKRGQMSDKGFGWLCKHNDLQFTRRRVNGVLGRFTEVRFRPLEDERLPEQPLSATVIAVGSTATSGKLQ